VTFSVDGVAVATVPLVASSDLRSSQATYKTSTLGAGTHLVMAVYSGDLDSTPSRSPSLVQIVVAAATSTALVVSPNPADSESPVFLTATVSQPVVLGGTVTFFDGTKAIGNAPIGADGVARFAIASLLPGFHHLSATFDGDLNLAPSRSADVVATINPPIVIDPVPVPSVVSVARGDRAGTTVVLTFSAALDPTRARRQVNYDILGPGGRFFPVKRADVSADGKTVVLHLRRRLSPAHTYRLEVVGAGPLGLVGVSGVKLDGSGKGVPGSDFFVRLPRSLGGGRS
jgi:hypothetical protein